MLRIRPEEDGDVDAVARVQVRAWQAGYAGIMPADVLAALDADAWARRRRGRRAAGGPFATLVAELDGTVVGFTTVGPYRHGQDNADLDPAYGEILALYVEPARWGTGVGPELLRRGCAVLSAEGFLEVRLWVLADNLSARRFYERAGLVADGERSVYRVRRPADQPPVDLAEVRYARRLDR